MMLLIGIAVAGALGTLARFGLGGWIQQHSGSNFPWGTLLINISGSLLLAFAFRYAEVAPVRPELRALVSIGFCGAFTTFSTFSYETARLIQDGQWNRAALYVSASVVISLAATFGGFQLATILLRRG
ncbi:MAG TPA: fluoride efflux transporter CrcB [Longimicrobiales bacterium]|nr:fluoride efflux transporter CrcB [Longimicrobiales bacterium]